MAPWTLKEEASRIVRDSEAWPKLQAPVQPYARLPYHGQSLHRLSITITRTPGTPLFRVPILSFSLHLFPL